MHTSKHIPSPLEKKSSVHTHVLMSPHTAYTVLPLTTHYCFDHFKSNRTVCMLLKAIKLQRSDYNRQLDVS